MKLNEEILGRLKPCPFCGKHDLSFASNIVKIAPYDEECREQKLIVWVECDQCGGRYGINSAYIDQTSDNHLGYDVNFINELFDAIERLIRGWNKRENHNMEA